MHAQLNVRVRLCHPVKIPKKCWFITPCYMLHYNSIVVLNILFKNVYWGNEDWGDIHYNLSETSITFFLRFVQCRLLISGAHWRIVTMPKSGVAPSPDLLSSPLFSFPVSSVYVPLSFRFTELPFLSGGVLWVRSGTKPELPTISLRFVSKYDLRCHEYWTFAAIS